VGTENCEGGIPTARTRGGVALLCAAEPPWGARGRFRLGVSARSHDCSAIVSLKRSARVPQGVTLISDPPSPRVEIRAIAPVTPLSLVTKVTGGALTADCDQPSFGSPNRNACAPPVSGSLNVTLDDCTYAMTEPARLPQILSGDQELQKNWDSHSYSDPRERIDRDVMMTFRFRAGADTQSDANLRGALISARDSISDIWTAL